MVHLRNENNMKEKELHKAEFYRPRSSIVIAEKLIKDAVNLSNSAAFYFACQIMHYNVTKLYQLV